MVNQSPGPSGLPYLQGLASVSLLTRHLMLAMLFFASKYNFSSAVPCKIQEGMRELLLARELSALKVDSVCSLAPASRNE